MSFLPKKKTAASSSAPPAAPTVGEVEKAAEVAPAPALIQQVEASREEKLQAALQALLQAVPADLSRIFSTPPEYETYLACRAAAQRLVG